MTPAVAVLIAILSAGSARGRDPVARDFASDVRAVSLPSRIVHDFGRLGSRESLRILGVGGVAAAAAHPADMATLTSLSSSHAAEATLDGGATLGGSAVQFGLAGAVYGVGLVTRNEKTAVTGTHLLEAQIVGGVIAQGVKHAVDRARPNGGRYSFPSGHTESAFVTADVLLQRFGWKIGIPAYAGAVYVGAARIAEREHYLSDVVFGAAIGIASARAVAHQGRIRSVRMAPVLARRRAATYAGLEVVW